MKRLYILVAALMAWAAVANAAEKTVYLPTKVTQTNDAQTFQVEYAYDAAGHVVLKKGYENREGSLVLVDSVGYEYHKLPNGSYVKTKEATRSSSYKAAYDNKGMMLWEEDEYCLSLEEGGENCSEKDFSRTEAIVDGNGIRIGLRQYNEDTKQMETVTGWTFDAKGRVTGITDEGGSWTFSWGSDDIITSAMAQFGGTNTSIQNIETVMNGAYFDTYSLYPWGGSSKDEAGYFIQNMQVFNWHDYELRQWVFNANVNIGALQGTIRSVMNESENELTITTLMLGIEDKNIYKILPNGSWENYSIENGDTTNISIKEYSEHGALIREYSYYTYSEGGFHKDNTTYTREYDAQNRPIKTTCNKTTSYQYMNDETGELQEPYTHTETIVETYSEWASITIEPTGLKEPEAVTEIIIYPNPTTNGFYIKGKIPNTDITLTDISGKVLLTKLVSDGEYVPTSHLPQGMYIVRIGNAANKLLIK